tara:strand:+ start:28 stop:594 length:567 start_codon:yes stop_codon:yes gene_type:complete
MSKLETNTIDTVSGTTNLTIGSTNSSTVTFENGAATGHMYPAFAAYLSSDQTINDVTETKVPNNVEIFDTDNCYDNSTNYRFTPTIAGKYFVYARVNIDDAAGNNRNTINYIYKNGSRIIEAMVNFHSGDTTDGESASVTITTIVDMNGSSDYLEQYALGDTVNGGTTQIKGAAGKQQTEFGAYRIGS